MLHIYIYIYIYIYDISRLRVNVACYIITDFSDEKLLFLNRLIFDPENEGNIFFLNIDAYLNVYRCLPKRLLGISSPPKKIVLHNIQGARGSAVG